MILALAGPPRATFGCLHAPPGAKRGLGAEEICGPLPPCRKASLPSLQTATDRGLRRYSPPPRARTLRCIRSVHALTLSSVRSSPSLVRSFGRSYARALIRPFQNSLIRPSLIRSHARSFISGSIRSFTARTVLLQGFPYSSLARSLSISAFARSFAHSPIRSFVVVTFVHVWLDSCTHRSLGSCLCFLYFIARSLADALARSLMR